MVRFSHIDPMVSGSNPQSAKLPHFLNARIAQWYDSCASTLWSVVRVPPQLKIYLHRGETLALCNAMRMNYEVSSHRKEGINNM